MSIISNIQSPSKKVNFRMQQTQQVKSSSLGVSKSVSKSKDVSISSVNSVRERKLRQSKVVRTSPVIDANLTESTALSNSQKIKNKTLLMPTTVEKKLWRIQPVQQQVVEKIDIEYAIESIDWVLHEAVDHISMQIMSQESYLSYCDAKIFYLTERINKINSLTDNTRKQLRQLENVQLQTTEEKITQNERLKPFLTQKDKINESLLFLKSNLNEKINDEVHTQIILNHTNQHTSGMFKV
ncbi:Hypothetical_protein [Hexamita inflata]|uniref:Hypothetical_protein n=1 Tax=Hexamita inflata TaxID=28002 RepID=A0AA86NF28_9EUKA|nr:Hypothetical protein HINF_LOCUS6172 [Hexamita inflata]